MNNIETSVTSETSDFLAEKAVKYEAPSVTAHHMAQAVQGNGSQDPDAGAAFPGFL